MIEAGFFERDRVGDILHRGAVIAFLAEDLGSRLNDLTSLHRHTPYRPVGRYIVAQLLCSSQVSKEEEVALDLT